MITHRILLIVAALFLIPALGSAVAPAPQAQPAAATPAAPVSAKMAAPSLSAFLASLDGSAVPPLIPASGCEANFCTQAQRDACTQQCLRQHHGTFVGLECCSNCTTLCICGSVPVDC